ncbi:MAG: hypothetical protein ABW185_28800 [Sedimenticola sp.]
MAKVAKTIRKDIFDFDEQFQFSGDFPPGCQSTAVPDSLNALVSMIVNGPTMKDKQSTLLSQACLTISQLMLFNTKKTMPEKNTNTRHTVEREPPLVVYLGLNIHSLIRSKRLIKQLNKMGVCISYARVQQLESNIALNMSRRFAATGVVCPSKLRSGLFVVGAMDNIDHNPSSTTAHSSFHGMALASVSYSSRQNIIVVNPKTQFRYPT